MSEPGNRHAETSSRESIWLLTAEIGMEGKLGFMNLTLWAFSRGDAIQRLEAYLSKYEWALVSISRAVQVDTFADHGDEANDLIAFALRDRKFIGLGTYFSYATQ